MNSIQTLLSVHLDIWTSALLTKSTAGRGSNGKLEAYGIKKLRELILELAVCGKLVPQDPHDEPASELFKRIAVEKSRLIAEGRIKEGKSLSAISEEEKTCQLPQSWGWSRIADLTSVLNGRAYSKQELLDSGIPVLRVGNLFTSNDWYYSNLELEEDKYCDAGDLIFSWSASFGPFIWAGPKVIYHYHIWKLNLHSEADLNKNYLYKFLLEKTQEMKASGHGVSMIHMTKETMEKMVVPVPPLAEQRRIVAKIDELMALCDQLEQQQTHSIAAHQTLVETLLGTLTRVASPQEFSEAWARIANHFDILFTTEASIDQLKQTILQLAVMGKLVPQDPNDEPASVLLKTIRDERVRLVNEGLRKDVPVLPIGNHEEPFKLPVGWVWMRFGEMGEIIGGGTPSKSNPRYWVGQIPWVSPKDMKVDFISDSIDTISEEAVEGSAVKLVPPGSLLIVVRGMILAHSFPVAITRVPITVNQDMKAVVIDGLYKNYVLLMVKALKNEFVAMVDRSTHGTCKLVSEKLWAKVLPIPPVEEQHRIVAKVDELMALCDALKARLADAQATQLHLADAIVEQAVC